MITYNRIITDDEQKILENDLLDIVDWINKAIEGKINNCSKRLAQTEAERLKNTGAKMIPASVSDLCKSALVNPGYLNRKKREELINSKG